MAEELDNQVQETPEYEMNHTDKLVGVFTEPGATFTTVSHFPVKVVDWILPLLLSIVVTIISVILITSNPIIKQQIMQKQQEQVQKLVDEGVLTQEQADQQMQIMEQYSSGAIVYVFQGIGILISLTILFFIVTGFYYLLIRFVLHGEGGYKNILVAYGLPIYILIIQGILIVILSLATDKMATSTSLGFLLGLEPKDFIGFIASKIDPLSIWFYVVFGIASAKMFKSENTGKYIGMIIGIWLVANIIFFFIAQAVPMLGGFIGMGQ